MTKCRDCRHWIPKKGQIGKCKQWVPKVHRNGMLTMNYYHGSQRACKKNFEENTEV